MRSLLAMVVLGAGCAANVAGAVRTDVRSDAPTATISTMQAVPGELMEYELTLRGLTVGRVQVAVGEPGEIEGRRAIIVKSGGGTEGVVALLGELRWEMTTTIDLETGYALAENEKFSAVVAGKKRQADTTRAWSAADQRHNLHSGAAALRGWRSSIGDSSRLSIRLDGRALGVELTDVAREAVGNTPAVRYDGLAVDKYKISIWISDDEDRVPLRVKTETKLGDIGVVLVRYE